MKKLVTAACALVAASAFAVESENVVGYQDITVKPGFNCISLNFDAVGGGGISIQDLISTNDLIAGNAAATSDSRTRGYAKKHLGYHCTPPI